MLKLLQEICSIPTAPFAEQYMVRYVEAFVRRRPKLRLSRDSFGNLLIELPAKKRSPRLIFAAHIDHPGFVARRMIDEKTVEAYFRGWVQINYVNKTKVRFFDDGREIPGTVLEATGAEHDRLSVPDRVKIRVSERVPPGSPGMFDQGAGRTKGKLFYSRGIDDQGGVASAMAMLDVLHKKPPENPVAVLLTRAEEEGFIGAIAVVLKPKLLKKSDRIISIECSAEQPYAQQGHGVIIRVGDRTSIFNSSLTYFLTQQAEKLAKRDKTFRYQRALMPGGTCEATVYDVYGYVSAAVCVPLGNYHNMDKDKKKIGPEYINIDDWQNMVKLFVALAREGHTFEEGNQPLKDRVEKRFEKLKRFLSNPL
ncbi:MAG TPA: M20/M25/M40 family metallo-hydrolase [Tepidisphaeraceae bacterium]|jgi:endoglucanase